jgi:transcriptional regulator with XRE-family HTH domain
MTTLTRRRSAALAEEKVIAAPDGQPDGDAAAHPQRTKTAPPPKIGRKLHALRKSRGLTLEDVEAMSGISKSMLSQIERGRANPTFGTLWNLTQSLGTSINRLLDRTKSDAGRSRHMEHLDVHMTPTITSQDGKCKFHILSPRRISLPVEWYEVRLDPGGASRAHPHGASSWEHWTCLTGQITIEVGDKEVVLNPGETLRYMAEVKHGVRNDTRRPAHGLLIVIMQDELAGHGHAHGADEGYEEWQTAG